MRYIKKDINAIPAAHIRITPHPGENQAQFMSRLRAKLANADFFYHRMEKDRLFVSSPNWLPVMAAYPFGRDGWKDMLRKIEAMPGHKLLTIAYPA